MLVKEIVVAKTEINYDGSMSSSVGGAKTYDK